MVTLILTRIVFVLSIPLCLYAVYFGVVALFGLRKKLPAAPQAKPEKRFALVVAARNEAAVIGHLVDSLYGQDYPRELYEVIVAPNNCTDDTEAVAAGRGARIFRPEGVIRSKGEVLTQVVDKIVLAEEFDAMCVFDADNLNILLRHLDLNGYGNELIAADHEELTPYGLIRQQNGEPIPTRQKEDQEMGMEVCR